MSDPPTSLAEALFGKRTDDSVWQDRDIRFDIAPPELQCRGGEQVLHTVVSALFGVWVTARNHRQCIDLCTLLLRYTILGIETLDILDFKLVSCFLAALVREWHSMYVCACC